MGPDTDDLDRRTVLHGAAGVLAAGALAGCSSGGSGDGGSNDSGGSGTETEAATGGDAATETTATDAGAASESADNESADNASTANGTAEASETTGANATTAANGTAGTNNTSATNGTSGTTVGTGAVDEYLAEAKGYDGSIADETGSDAVEIAVGAGESGFAFDPAAVRVSPGTTITWAWTGKGGTHNVVSEGDGPLNSGQPAMGEDVTYEETLDSAGVYSYYCNPHRSLGMKGAIVVANE